MPGAAAEAARERRGDVDHPRVVGRDHRVALAAEQHLEAAYVGLVDLDLVLEGDVLGLHVGALAQPHPRALVGQRTAVGLGAVEHRLEHRARLGEVLAELAQDRERRVGGGVVLHVEGDRRAGVARSPADLAGVLQRDLVALVGEELADRAELDRDLGLAGQAAWRRARRARPCRRRRWRRPGRRRWCPRRGSRASTRRPSSTRPCVARRRRRWSRRGRARSRCPRRPAWSRRAS